MDKLTEKDIEVTADDQNKINRFARLNGQLEDFKDEVATKKKEMENIDDATLAADEALLMEDDDAMVSLQIGSVFVHYNAEAAQTKLGTMKGKLESDVVELDAKCESLREQMSKLKSDLYGKFGTNINLEPEED